MNYPDCKPYYVDIACGSVKSSFYDWIFIGQSEMVLLCNFSLNLVGGRGIYDTYEKKSISSV